MKFTYQGHTYSLSFHRQHKELSAHQAPHLPEGTKSARPYTTVNLYLWSDPDGVKRNVFRTATVGAWHREPVVNHEVGRLRALKAITRGNSLTKEFKQLMWDAYMDRRKTKVVA